jgi:hypothetical protein
MGRREDAERASTSNAISVSTSLFPHQSHDGCSAVKHFNVFCPASLHTEQGGVLEARLLAVLARRLYSLHDIAMLSMEYELNTRNSKVRIYPRTYE